MSRDSNSAPAWLLPTIDPRVLDDVDRAQEVNQLGPSALRKRAKTIPLGERPSISQVPALSLTSKDVVGIASDNRACRLVSLGVTNEQPRAISPAESCAKLALETLTEPFSYEDASQLPRWTASRARWWIRKLKARGELRATRAGHFKTEAWRR